MKSYVILISVVAALGGLLFGFDTAVISGTINFIQPYFGLSEASLGWTVSSLLFGCIAGVFLAGKAGDHYDHKKVLMLAGLSALYFTNQTSGVLVFILGYIAFFAALLGPALWVVAAELFPNLRSKGMSIAIVLLWIACTIVTIAFPIMLEKLNGGITFLIFALICLANLLYVLKYVPETKGKTLEELEKEFAK
jgi:MFS family permease